MNPIRARVPAGSRVGSLPSTSTSPSLGRRAPVRSRMAVVLPAPLGPMTPTMEPRGISRVTSVRASTSSNWRLTPRSAAIGGSAVGASATRLGLGSLVMGWPVGPCWASRTSGSLDTGAVSRPDRCRRPASGQARHCGSMSAAACARATRHAGCPGRPELQCGRKVPPRGATHSVGPATIVEPRDVRVGPQAWWTSTMGPIAGRSGPFIASDRSRSATSGRWSEAAHRSDGSTVPWPQATTAGASSGPSIR